MRLTQILQLFLVLLLVLSCAREESVISDYRDLAKELKDNSSEYTKKDWENVINRYEKLEKEVELCEFSPKERKELNRLRGQCAAYVLKSVTKQAKYQMEDAIEQFSDMAEGFKEVFEEEDIDSLFND